MRNAYVISGLQILTDRPVPGLLPGPGSMPCDVECWFDRRPAWVRSVGAREALVWRDAQSWFPGGAPRLSVHRLRYGWRFRFAYAAGMEFILDEEGARLWATWVTPMTFEDMATVLVGVVLGFVQRLRGRVCLHASAIEMQGRAVAFLGHSGSGKSTLAAAFAARAHAVLCDDVAVTLPDNGQFMLQPAYPRLRLWPDAALAVHPAGAELPALTPTWEKRYLALDSAAYRFLTRPLALGCICLLAGFGAAHERPRIERLSAREALLALVATSYASFLLSPIQRAGEFALFATMVHSVPVVRVVSPHGLDRLPDICAALGAALTPRRAALA